jgi:hypothetical protein
MQPTAPSEQIPTAEEICRRALNSTRDDWGWQPDASNARASGFTVDGCRNVLGLGSRIIQAPPAPSLDQLAHAAVNEYYRRHASDSGTPPSEIADLYASQVIWYHGARLSPGQIVQKKINEVFSKWPTRRFSVREPLAYDCDRSAPRCRVSGTVDFSFANSQGRVLNDHALIELEFSDLTGRPKVTSEWSKRDTVR